MTKKDKEHQSIFKTAIIASPIAIGGGMGISALRKASSHFSEAINPVEKVYTNSTIRKFTNRYANPIYSGTFKDWELDRLTEFSKSTALTRNEIKSSIFRAAESVDPTGDLARFFNSRLKEATTGREVLEDLRGTLRESNSVYAKKAISIFMRDLNVLQDRVDNLLPIETKVIETSVPFRNRYVSLENLDSKMQADIQKMSKMLGAKVHIRELSRKDSLGRELALEFSKSDKFQGKIKLHIPRVIPGQENIINRGGRQQSRYIAGTYGIVEDGILRESFNHEQWNTRRAVEDLIPKMLREKHLEQRQIRQMVSEFQKKMIEPTEGIPTSKPGSHLGVDEYIKQRSNIMHLYTEAENGGVRAINEFEYHRLIEKGGASRSDGSLLSMFPGHSPGQISRGVVSLKDSRDFLSLIPEATPYGRRPSQFIRMGSEPLSPELLKGSRVGNMFSWAKASAGVDAPIVRAAYISSKLDSNFANTGVSSEGQLLITDKLAGQRAVRKFKQYDISSSSAVDLKDIIGDKQKGFWDVGKKVDAGAFLGYDPSGNPVRIGRNAEIMHVTAFENKKGKGNFLKVLTKEDIEKMRYSKVFGGAKGMAKETSSGYISDLLNRIGKISVKEYTASEIDAIITMDELKKNRGLHYNQMLTSLWDYTRQNMEKGSILGPRSASFVENPINIISEVRRAAFSNGNFQHDVALKTLGELARESNLNPEQMGRVFGAVPDVFGDLSALGGLSPAEAQEINKGIATGATQLWFEDLGGSGAGNIGTIEPRTIELFDSPHFGKMGAQIKEDIVHRMSEANSFRFLEQAEITKAIDSIDSLGQRGGAISPSEIASSGMPSRSTSMSVSGIGDIYIPGSNEITQLSEFKTPTGLSIKPPLAKSYENIIDAAKRFESGKIEKEEMLKHLSTLKKDLISAKIETVTGAGGILRGKLPGSTSLTATESVSFQKIAPGSVGITSSSASRMFESMQELGIYSPEKIEKMRKTFESGGQVAGTIGRHPYIGPYSTQVVNFQKIAGSDPIAAIPHKMEPAIAMPGKLKGKDLEAFTRGASNYFKSPKKMAPLLEKMGGEVFSSPIRTDTFIGLAADTDGDTLVAMMGNPEMQDSMRQHMQNPKTISDYENYAIRSQILKAKAEGETLNLRKLMAGDAVKLSVTQSGRLGMLSSQLQQYRASILMNPNNLGEQRRKNALGLLEWMEQTPISSKHIAPGKELEMLHILDNVQESLNRRSPVAIESSVRTIMTKATNSGQSMLNEGMTIATEAGGSRFIPGLNVRNAAIDLTESIIESDKSIDGQASPLKMRQILLNKTRIQGEDGRLLKNAQKMEQSIFGDFFHLAPGKASSLGKRGIAMANRLGAAGKKMIAAARPLALGTAAAIGLAAVLSKPGKVLPMGSTVAPAASMRSGTGGADLGYGTHVENPRRGEPTARGMVSSQNSARLAQPETSGYRIDIRGEANDGTDISSLSNQIRGSIRGNTRVNSSIRDNRSSMTAQKLAAILNDD